MATPSPLGRGPPKLPSWARAAIDNLSAVRAFGLGVIIELRPKSALLACVVSLQVHAATRGDPGPLGVIVIYVLIATSTVTLPVLATIISPARMEPRLARAANTLGEEAADQCDRPRDDRRCGDRLGSSGSGLIRPRLSWVMPSSSLAITPTRNNPQTICTKAASLAVCETGDRSP